MTNAKAFGTAPALVSCDTRPDATAPPSEQSPFLGLPAARPPAAATPRHKAGRLMTSSVSTIPITLHKQTDTHHDH